jgi:arabinofuranan 3-O-arabinosyltransferase
VLLGTLLVTAGHVGSLPVWLTPPLAEPLRELLDGPLAPFRNVHKFDAVLRLPLVLGLAHLASTVRLPARPELPAVLREPATRPVAALAALACVVGAAPLLSGGSPPRRVRGAAVVVDGRGRLARRAHAARTRSRGAGCALRRVRLGPPARRAAAAAGRLPLGRAQRRAARSEGNTRLLDAIEEQLDSGHGSAGLAPVLTRAGVTHVVVRHDLDWLAVGAPPPWWPSRRWRVGGAARRRAVPGARPRVPPLRVFEVAGADREGSPAASPVATYAADRLVRLSGGPESLLEVADLAPGLLRESPVLLAGEPGSDRAGAVVLTDGMRRREVDFGRTRGGSSHTLAIDEPLRLDRPAADLAVVAGGEHLTTATYDGARAVRASSSASDAGSWAGSARRHLPWAAFDDDDRETAWLTGDGPAEEQWIEVELDAPRLLDAVVVLPVLDGPARPVATVRVTTDAGQVEARVTRARTSIPLPAGPTSRVRVTFADVPRGVTRAGLLDVTVPGVRVQRVLAVPADAGLAPERPVSVALRRTGDLREACLPTSDGPLCAEGLRRTGEESGSLERAFTTVVPADLELTVVGSPLPGPALDARLARVRPGLEARASRTAFDAPLASAAAVLDIDYETAWIAPPEASTLELAWDEPREVSRLRVSADTLFGIEALGQPQLVAWREGAVLPLTAQASDNGYLAFGPVVADRLTLTFPAGDDQLRISEVHLPELDDLHEQARDAADLPVHVPCGEGPELELDGKLVQTSFTASYGDVARLEQLELAPCRPSSRLALDIGEHRLSARSSALVRVDGVLLRDVRMPQFPAAVPSTRPVVDVDAWGETSRRVRVGAGAATYLAVKENANAGWSATLDGRALQAHRLDGWQQGWLLPAGGAGTVELVYTPDRGFRLGLLAGLAAAAGLVALACRSSRRPALRPAAGAPVGGFAAAALAATALVLLGGPAGAAALSAGLLAHRCARALPTVVGAVVLAGLLVALRPWPEASAGADAAVPQLLVLAALGTAAVALLSPRPGGEPAVDEP